MPSQLQILTIQFNALLDEYQDTSKKYTHLITTLDNTLTPIPESSFVGGESNVVVLDKPNASSCQSACYENKFCIVSTFNPILNSCTLSMGDRKSDPTMESVAIVEKAMYYRNRLKELNNELTLLNEQMINVSKQKHNQYSKNNHKIKQEEVIMLNNNKVLIKERKEIDDMMNQFQTLNAAYEDGNLTVNSNYMHYIVFMFVIIFLVLLLLRTTVSSPQYGGGNRGGNRASNGSIDKRNILFIVFGIFIVFTVIKYMQNN
jgi:hypothetical protein